ncbi:Nn.00g043720.m01.CDS01 [Neocucurbitaria sp. VM-36]
MASYFDLPPQETKAVASIEQVPKEERKQLGQMSLLSPAVTQLLDDLGDEKSDSGSEEGNPSDDESLVGNKDSKKLGDTRATSYEAKQKLSPQTPPVPSSLSPRRSSPKSYPNKGSKHVKISSGGGSTKPKHPHMARFHSLRSMLFSANLEDKMNSVQQEEHEREEAADKWKEQHEQRQMHRPKTPEKDAQGSDGIRSRIKTGIQRMTSKEVPTMESIGEDGAPVKFDDRASTASSDNEYEPQEWSWKPRDSDEESINHSDVEDIVRWVSRRDPPSDGEARKDKSVQEIKEDSGHDSLGQSDVDDLVRYVSRRSVGKREEEAQTGYSDVSTESDSEMATRSSEEEENADDLVRWISQREGSKAGPVRRNLESHELDAKVEQHYDSDVPELGRWYKRNNETSGDAVVTTPGHEIEDQIDEPERGRPRSRSESPIITEPKTHLRSDDIPELVRWVSRKDVKQPDPIIPDTAATTIQSQRDENDKSNQVNMQADQDSLNNVDVQDLVEHARKRSDPVPSEPSPLRPNELESGDLRTLRFPQPQVEQIRRDEDKKKQLLGMTVDQGSLSHSDVQDLIQHANSKASQGSQSGPSASASLEDERNGVGKKRNEDRTGSLANEDVDELVRWVSKKDL